MEGIKRVLEKLIKREEINQKIIEKLKLSGKFREVFRSELKQGDIKLSFDTIVNKNFKKEFGDIALVYYLEDEDGKKLVISEYFHQVISADKLFKDNFEKINFDYPPYINFSIKKEYLLNQLNNILDIKNNFGKNTNLKNKKVIIEYTDPNPFKEFHIGHLMSNAIGESLSRVYEFQGAQIKRANYQGDVGLHVAKAIYGYINLETPYHGSEIGKWAIAYQNGSKAYESGEGFKNEINEINKKVYEGNDKKINKLYAQGKKESLKYFEGIYKKLGTKFDYYFFESEVADFGKKIVEEALKKGIYEKGERGAVIYRGEKHGLHTRVFINSEGLPTYEAKELGLAKIKYDKYKYDTSVIVTGNEINNYFEVLLLALKEVFPELAKKTKHVGHGMLRLPEGKMSSRAGKVVTAESLIEKVKEVVRQKAADKSLDDKVIEMIAIGALKYSILKQSIGGDIIFDFEKSISFEGDSGPYLQYALTRANSVLKKAKTEKIKPSTKNVPSEIDNILKILDHFPDIVERSLATPHYLGAYLKDISREFNNYYAHHKIVDAKDELSPYRVALTQAFSHVMKNGLWLLGIEAPERM